MTLERVVYFQISNLVTGSANVISGKQKPFLWSRSYSFYLKSQQFPDFNIYVVNFIMILSPVFLGKKFFPYVRSISSYSQVTFEYQFCWTHTETFSDVEVRK